MASPNLQITGGAVSSCNRKKSLTKSLHALISSTPIPEESIPYLVALLQNELNTYPKQRSYTFKPNAKGWIIGNDSNLEYIQTRKDGFQYLHFLLQNPGKVIHVMQVYHIGQSAPEIMGNLTAECVDDISLSSPQALIDETTRRSISQRITELKKQIAISDVMPSHPDQKELTQLTDYLSQSNNGVRRNNFTDESEKARVNVQKKIKSALTEIIQVSPDLGSHLKNTINTGYEVIYSPAPINPPEWDLF